MKKLFAIGLLCCSFARAQGIITTVAGGDLIYPTVPVPATSVPLTGSNRLAVDSAGNIYVSMFFDLVLRISPDGRIRAIAGNYFTGFSGDGGPATGASLSLPQGVALDRNSNLYIADRANHRVRMISASGIITTVAGLGEEGFSGDSGPGTNARFSEPSAVAVDAAGNLYIADSGNGRIRRVTSDGMIDTWAGNGSRGFAGDGGPATQASFQDFEAMVFDGSGNLFIADQGNGRIRKITPAGIVSTVAGNGKAGFSGDNAQATAAMLDHPSDVFADAAGNLFIADAQNNRVRKVTADGVIRTVAGSGNFGFSGDGGQATAASIAYPTAVVVDAAGSIYIRESTNRIRKVAPTGIITTFAGNGLGPFAGDGGAATNALLGDTMGLALDRNGNLYIADPDNNRVRKVTPAGVISTIAGNGAIEGYRDGVQATTAPIPGPEFVAVDATGNVYLTGQIGSRILRIAPSGIVTTFAGTGQDGFAGDGRAATAATLNFPGAMAVDSGGNLFFVDRGNQRIRRIATDGTITTVAGNGQAAYTGDGGAATSAALNDPHGIALDAAGTLFIADWGNQAIRKVVRGTISTVLKVESPEAVAPDAAGNLYFSNSSDNIVQRIALDGTVSIVAGDGHIGFTGDGGPAIHAALRQPVGILTDPSGNVFFADSLSHRVRMLVFAFSAWQASPASLTFSGASGVAAPADKSVNLTSTPPGLAFTASADAPWLHVSTATGVMPASIQIGVDVSALDPGAYNGNITISAPAASPGTRTIAVQLTVTPGGPPHLSVDSPLLTFNLSEGAAPFTTHVTVSNSGAGTLAFTAAAAAASGGNWLTVAPASGNAAGGTPATVDVTIALGNLTAGIYTGTVSIASATTGESVAIPVNIAVSKPQQSILLSQIGLTFTTVQGGGAPLAQEVDILNAGQGAMAWKASVATLSAGPSWLTGAPASGTVLTPFDDLSPLTVGVDASALQPGVYYGQIQVTAAGADNSPQSVSVILNVLPRGSNPGPDVRPSGLVFVGEVGTRPGSQSISIANLSAAVQPYGSSRTFVGSDVWFDHTPGSSALAPGQPAAIFVQPDFRTVAPGVQRGALTLLFGDGSVRTVSVLGVAAPVEGASARPAARARCAPTGLLVQFVSLNSGFSVTALQPTGLQVRVVDTCGAAVTDGAVVARFSNDDPAVRLAHIQNGMWSGTWLPRAAPGAPVQIAVTAYTALTALAGQTILSGNLLPGGGTPVIRPGAVVNAASFQSQAPVAPGSLVTVLGSNLADSNVNGEGLPLRTELGGTQLVLGGRALPLLFASDTQVNAQVPYDLPVNTNHQLIVRRGTALSVPEVITVAAAEPAIFSADQTGQGQGVILRVDSGAVADRSNPAHTGDAISILCAGLGQVTPLVPEGTAATSDAPAVNLVQLLIGGQAAHIDYAGLALGTPGVYRITATVPPNTGTGDQIPVVIVSAGQTSPAVTMAIR